MQDKIQEIIQSVNLEEYARRMGYTILKDGHATSKWISLKSKTTNDNIRIRRKPFPMVFQNNSQALEDDKGNIINFLMNRLEPGIIIPSYGDKEKAKKALNILKEEIGEVRSQTNFEYTKDQKKSDYQNIQNKIKNLSPPGKASENYIVERRKINLQTLNSNQFKGSIMEAPVRLPNDKVIFNTAFIKRNIDGQIKGYVSHFYSKKSEKNEKRVFQHENPGINRTRIHRNSNKIFIGESFIDCMSHFEIKQPKNSVYASLQGQVSKDELKEIYSIYQRVLQNFDKKDEKPLITSITDNDYTGYRYDLTVAIELNNLKNPDKFIEKVETSQSTKLIFNDQDLKASETYQKMKEILDLESSTYKDHSQKAYLNFVQLKGKAIFEFPADIKNKRFYLHLSPLSKFIFKYSGYNFSSQKSKSKDWNQDLQNEKKILEEFKNLKKSNLIKV